MQIELKRIQTEVGITFVHVTHDQEEAMTMADTVAVMNAGRIEQLGAPAELYEYPATTFVANFLGQSNLLAADARRPGRAEVPVDAHGIRFSVPADRARADRGAGLARGTSREGLHLVEAVDQVPAGAPAWSRGVITDVSLHRGEHPVPACAPAGAGAVRVRANSGVGGQLPVGATVVAALGPPARLLLPREPAAGRPDHPAGRRAGRDAVVTAWRSRVAGPRRPGRRHRRRPGRHRLAAVPAAVARGGSGCSSSSPCRCAARSPPRSTTRPAPSTPATR